MKRRAERNRREELGKRQRQRVDNARWTNSGMSSAKSASASTGNATTAHEEIPLVIIEDGFVQDAEPLAYGRRSFGSFNKSVERRVDGHVQDEGEGENEHREAVFNTRPARAQASGEPSAEVALKSGNFDESGTAQNADDTKMSGESANPASSSSSRNASRLQGVRPVIAKNYRKHRQPTPLSTGVAAVLARRKNHKRRNAR